MVKKKKAKKIAKKTSKRPRPKVERIPTKKTRVRIIGIGGGGGSIVSEITSKVKKASFVVANTDLQALRKLSRNCQRFQFGQAFTRGLGTGMNPDLAKEIAKNEKNKIERILKGQDLCVLIVCLGGGAGSGAAPVFAKISRELGNMTYGIFTLPFSFEGEKKTRIALSSLERMKPYLNAYTCIPNERIFQIIDKKTPLKTALSLINKSLTDGLRGLIKMIYEPGLINIDFADLRTVLEFDSSSRSRRGKLAYLNTIEVQRKEGGAKEAVERAISSPLYPYTIRGAKGVLLDIGGEKNLSLNEVNQISKSIHELVDKEAKIIFGISQGKQYRDRIKTTLLAVGCGQRSFSRKKRVKKKVKKIKIEIPKEKEVKIVRKKRKKVIKKTPRLKKVRKVKKVTISKKVKVRVPKKAPVPSVAVKETEPKVKVRKNALQLRKEVEEAERKMLAQEKIWETPAFLRKKLEKNYD